MKKEKRNSIALPSLSSEHAYTLYELRKNYRQPDVKGSISIPIEICDKMLKTEYSSEKEDDLDYAQLECFLTDLAQGSGAELSVNHDCGAHLCRVEHYIFASGLKTPAHLSASVPIEVELSFDHQSVLVSSIMAPFGISQLSAADCPACEASPWRSYQVNLATFKTRPFASCFSLTLSPKLDGYACRDDKGNVLFVPLSGGTPTLKVEAQLAKDEQIVLFGPFYDYPTPVTFLSPSEIEFYLEIEHTGTIPVGGELFTSRLRKAAW